MLEREDLNLNPLSHDPQKIPLASGWGPLRCLSAASRWIWGDAQSLRALLARRPERSYTNRHGIGAWRSPVSALVWETRGRRFKSSRSDQFYQLKSPQFPFAAASVIRGTGSDAP